MIAAGGASAVSGLSVAVQVLLTLATSAGVLSFFTIRQQRAKLRAEAGKTGADAAGVLTDNALKMVTEARAQADRALARAEKAQQTADECGERTASLEDHVRQLERVMRDQGVPTGSIPARPYKF